MRRISPANTGSRRTRSQSSLNEESVPDRTFIACNATLGNGGSRLSASRISCGVFDSVRFAARVPIDQPKSATELGFLPYRLSPATPRMTEGRVPVGQVNLQECA